MKRIKNSDIKFRINKKLVYLPNFTIRFYTVNQKEYFFEKTQDDLVEYEREATVDDVEVILSGGTTVTEYYLPLNWSELLFVGQGILNYKLTNNIEDPEFPDYQYNKEEVVTTDFYIDSIKVDPEPDEGLIERVVHLEEHLAEEIVNREEADAIIRENLNEEEARAVSAETALDEKIDDEIERATSAETALNEALQAETNRATAAEAALDTKIDQEIADRQTDVNAEEARAISAETALDAKIDAETNRATSAETALQTAINDEATARANADTALQTAITNEVSRAIEAESGITNSLNAEVTRATGAENTLDDKIDAETTRATSAEAALDVKIGTVSGNVISETTRATTAENALDEKIDQEIADRTADVDAEETRAKGVENALSGAIDTLDVRFFDDAKYEDSGNTKVINFYNGNVVKATIDASDFIVDGMVEDVRIENGYLVIDFNTASGKQDIQIPLTDIFNPSNYYTKSETSGATEIANALTEKQNQLIAGENITISGNVISAEDGGKAIEAGRGISVTTGETADTVSISLPISAGTNNLDNITCCGSNTTRGQYAVSFGNDNAAIGGASLTFGRYCSTNDYDNVAGGFRVTTKGNQASSFGQYTKTENEAEHSVGRYNVSNKANGTFGDSGNTLFSVGNGTSSSARHNAFEIRQNGDIYLTKDGQDVKLQDQLGGSSYTAGDGIDITNDVISVTGKVSTSDFNTYSGAVYTLINSKASQSTVDTLNGVVTAHTANTTVHVTSSDKEKWNKVDDKADTTAVTAAIDAAVSGKADSSDVYLKSETSGATEIANALGNKQDTLVAGENITISGNVISAEGGGGKAVSGGTNISITTGETADTINCTLPMSTDSVKKIVVDSNYSSFVTSDAVFTADSLSNSILLGNNTFKIKGIIKGKINNNLIIGSYNTSQLTNGTSPTLEGNLVVGSNNQINSSYSLLVGSNNTISRGHQFAIGYNQHPNNEYEISLGAYNVSSSGSSTFGDSGNTLFSVGNGTSSSARHNAFEIRQNGDIYLTLDGQDVKLQDQLGGGGGTITIDPTLDSGSTNAVANSAITNAINTVSGDSVCNCRDIATVESSDSEILTVFETNSGGILPNGIYRRFRMPLYIDTTDDNRLKLAINTAVTSASTDSQIPSAKAVYDALGSASGGISSAECQTMIDQSISGKTNQSDFTGHTANTSIHVTTAQTAAWDAKSDFSGSYNDLTDKPTIPTVPTSNTAFTNDAGYITANDITGKTDVTAFTSHTGDTTIHVTSSDKTSWNGAVTNASNAVTALGGLSLVKLTQAQYDALVTKDNNTLYVIVG